MKWIKNISISKKLYSLVSIIAFLITVELITLYHSANTLSYTSKYLLFTLVLTLGFTAILLAFFVLERISTGLKEITQASTRILKGDLSEKGFVLGNDEISNLATHFNILADELSDTIRQRTQAEQELESKTHYIRENDKRISNIMDALIKITQMDFSEKIEISDARDEIDAIAVGLNTLSEELEFHLNELTLSEEKLNEAQRLAKIGSWNIDIATNEVKWSNEMYHIYGYGNERFDLYYEKAMERMLPEDRAKSKARMNKNIENALQEFKDKGTLEFKNPPTTFTITIPKMGTKVLQGISKITLNTLGQIAEIAGTVQDITEQFKTEDKLNQNNIELKRKNKEIEQFAYAASHDLQEPLRSISNFSALLAKQLEDNPDPKIRKHIDLINGGATRMSKLIFDLLEYSRIGKDLTKSVRDCNKLVQEVLTDLTSILKESGAEIHLQELPVINCYDLKSVFQNLILNAIKFKKKDTSPIVSISANEREKDFLFTIKDNGIGIEKEYYSRIFIIFQRLHTRFEYEGTGIGLSQCKKIIEQHEGEIWVESEFGEGSTFYFTIPKTNATIQ